MNEQLLAQIEAEAQAHEAARDRNLAEANQHQGAALALRALVARLTQPPAPTSPSDYPITKLEMKEAIESP